MTTEHRFGKTASANYGTLTEKELRLWIAPLKSRKMVMH